MSLRNINLRLKSFYFLFQDCRNSILLTLLTIFIALFVLQFAPARQYVIDLINSPLVVFLLKNTYGMSFIKDFVTLLALLVGAIWTYYIFIKGRTFKPRVSMNVSFNGKCDPGIGLFKVLVKNEGRVRIRPLTAPIEFSFVTFSQDGRSTKIIPFYKEDNIFIRYYESSEKFFLEPQDELWIDLPVPLSTFVNSLSIPEQTSNLISVKVILVDSRIRAWTEKRIICLPK